MGPLSGTLSISALPYAVSFWIVLIVGSVLPFYHSGPLPQGVNTVVAIVFIAPLLLRSDGAEFSRVVFVTLYLFLVFLVIGMLRTDDAAYALLKIDGGIIVPLLTSLVAIESIRKHGHTKTCKAMCWVLFGLLIATVLYKLRFGFFDRTVRFFLNGPIVFSWLMGILAILSLHLAIKAGSKIHYLLFLFAFLAVLWSMSKGPLVALSATLILYFITNLNSKKAASVFFGVCMMIFTTVYFLRDALLSSRYMAIFRVSDGDGVDEGSVGARMGMWTDSIGLAHDHPLFGVGLANWQFYTDTEFFYPHNFILELASEMGIVFTALMVAAIAIAGWKIRKCVFFPVVAFLFICLMFSGDTTYIRYPLALLITSYCVRHLWGDQKSCQQAGHTNAMAYMAR